MPRGFLIKRKKHQPHSWRKLVTSEDEHSESGSTSSEPENTAIEQHPQHGSPDSGFSQSSETFGRDTTIVDKSVSRRHFAKEWLQRNEVQKYRSDRPSSVDSLEADVQKESENVASSEDPNGNDVKTPSKSDSVQNRTPTDETEKKDFHEFNNNVNNNRDPFALFNRNFALNRYAALFGHKNGMSLSLPPSPNLPISTSVYGSPLYWPAAFNHLTLSSPQHFDKFMCRSPLTSPSSTTSSVCVRSPQGVSSSLSSPAKSVASPGKRKATPTAGSSSLCADGSKSSTKVSKRPKSARKISFEEEFKSSPVSGTYIKDAAETDEGIRVVSGDIDSSMNCVEITPEAEAELAKIENKIGDFICKLCKEFHENAFALAQHRCSRIVHVEYRCPECDKVFNCPANLASHRRWHKPKATSAAKTSTAVDQQKNTQTDAKSLLPDVGKKEFIKSATSEALFNCDQCGKKFRRQAYLKKHLASHALPQQPPQHKIPQSYLCYLCGCSFKSESDKSKHILQHHSPETNSLLSCGICSAAFVDTVALEQHQRCHQPQQQHGVTDIFTCKFCAETFYSIYSLGRHVYKCHSSPERDHSLSRQRMLIQPTHHQLID